MAALPIEQGGLVDSVDEFARFYRQHLPTVYGYALRLCAGDRSHAEDLTQDTWFALVREMRRDRDECADIRWLLTVVRSRFLDGVRRERIGAAKLRLVRPDVTIVDDPRRSEVLELLDGLQPLHRAVLMMRYVDDMTIPTIADELGRDLTATNSLLARAARTPPPPNRRRGMNDVSDLGINPDDAFAARLESELFTAFADPGRRAVDHPTPTTDARTRGRRRTPLEDMMVIELDEPVQDTQPQRTRWLAVAAAVVLAVGAGALLVAQRHDDSAAADTHDVTFEVKWPSLAQEWRCNGTTIFVSVTRTGCLRGFSGEAEIRGDITGNSLFDMVANNGSDPASPDAPPVDDPATFSATYLVKGTVAGCGSGEFMMAEITRFLGWESGQFEGTWQVMPASGRGDLVGLAGSGDVLAAEATAADSDPHRYSGSLTCG